MLSSLQHRTVFPFIIIMIIITIFIIIKPLLQKTVITIRVTILTIMPTWTLAVKMNNKIKKNARTKKNKKNNERAGLSCAMSLSSIFGETGFVAQLEPDPKHPPPGRKRGPPPLRLQPAPEWSAAWQQGGRGDGGASWTSRTPFPSAHLFFSVTHTHVHACTHTPNVNTLGLWQQCVCFFVLLDSTFLQVWLYRCIGLWGT